MTLWFQQFSLHLQCTITSTSLSNRVVAIQPVPVVKLNRIACMKVQSYSDTMKTNVSAN